MEDITILLKEAGDGKEGAAEKLIPLVYDQLRRIAQKRMEGERKGHTLQATALVNEVWIRLAGNIANQSWHDRAQFYRVAAEAMRRILIDHARRRGRIKRGGDRRRVVANVVDLAAEHDVEEIVAVDEAIQRLAKHDPRAGDVVRLRFFAGLTVEETAKVLGVSERTVLGDWSYAKAWLYKALGET